jgi:hypothetical protein
LFIRHNLHPLVGALVDERTVFQPYVFEQA